MVKLKELYMSENKIEEFPDLSNCDELEKLVFYGNRLKTVDDGIISNLMELRELSLANN